ncbi:MAG TPA: DUF429 domain-containing protein [Anaerolineales bacterium]|jgi:hypothetical protein|nr:DUF429 domain-containing protein [Anaerolineales bacterium]
MLFSECSYIGVDLSSGKKTIQYAAIDDQLELLALAQGDLNHLLTFLRSQQQAALAIHGPARPNQGILIDAERREEYLIPMSKGRPGNMRVAEYALRKQHLPTYRTPANSAEAPSWMQTSFKLYSLLPEAGYHPYKSEQPLQRTYMEVIPETCFVAWLEGKILPASTLHGRMQRQMVLYEEGLKVADPMTYFEEITRYRILQGILPKDIIYPTNALTALTAAYMAWVATKQPGSIAMVGIPEEGQIAVLDKLINRVE